MKNWRTTLAGALTIAVAICAAALEFLKTGTANWPVLVTGVTIGIGLVKAKDAGVTGTEK